MLSSSTLKLILIAVFIGAIGYFIFDPVMDYMLKKKLGDNSEAIINALHSGKKSPRILNRIGEVYSQDYHFENLDTYQDTLKFRITLGGDTSKAIINAWASKQQSGAWRIVKSDTVFKGL